jgi:molecular chaperone DnaK (HSP70)
MSPRFSIGIDLGTTNSALAYVDCGAEAAEPQASCVLPIEQLEDAHKVRAANTLPSALYLAPEHECDGRYNLEFQAVLQPAHYAVGLCARAQAIPAPDRVVQSAKSWLCHPSADPHVALLPFGADAGAVPSASDIPIKISPLEAATRVLRHFKDFWNSRYALEPELRFERQEICITVPASFDEVAQRLTLEAALNAGYPQKQLRLLEEPQAAFYYWLEMHADIERLRSAFLLPQDRAYTVLVIDVGGGTTDFTLFELAFPQQAQPPQITRSAVSDHLLLGGDNMDLALAHRLEPTLAQGGKLTRREWQQLVAQCRLLKERALSGSMPEQDWTVSVGASGSSLLKAARSASVSSTELRTLLLEGFFPLVEAHERPRRAVGGLREIGLPYASDTAITRHLAAFLQERSVDALLCNGGALRPQFLQQRLCDQIARWQSGRAPVLLENADMDLAVARGAAWCGYLRRLPTGSIKAGYPHAIYLGVQSAKGEKLLVCILPQGSEAGTCLRVDGRKFTLRLQQAAAFELYRSTQENVQAAQHRSGSLFDHQQLVAGVQALPPMQARLSAQQRKRKEVEVELEVQLNETGLLQIFCVEMPPPQAEQPLQAAQRWELQFNLRKDSQSEAPTEPAATAPPATALGVSAERARAALEKISALYGKAVAGGSAQNPKWLLRELEQTLGQPKQEWSLALLRMLWSALAPGVTKRSRSLAHELAWLALSGFVLRPGYGTEADRFRIAELWRAFEQGLYFKRERSAWTEWWILWRRISGGLEAWQQQQLFLQTLPELEGRKDSSPEAIRLLGSLERLSEADKRKASELMLQRLESMRSLRRPLLAALARIGGRTPLYAGVEALVPARWIEEWFAKLGNLNWRDDDWRACPLLFSQACRLIPSREFEVSETLRQKVLSKLRASQADPALILPLLEYVAPNEQSRALLFGEALPAGLVLAG